MNDKAQVLVIRRRTIGTIGSIVGAGGVISGVIALLWAGTFAPYVIGAFALGILGLLAWAIATPDEFIRLFTGQGVRFGTISIFSSLLLIGIVVLVYLQLTRTAWTFDTTQRNAYTLSPETERVLARVDRPIRIIGFYSARALRDRAIDDQIFQLYQTATNGLITREYINPDEQPALARRYGVTTDGQVFVAFVNPDGAIDLGTLFPVTRGVGQEREITRAIASLIVAGRIVVYFESGLGGRDPNDVSQEGISSIVGGVRQNGIVPQALDLPALAQRGGSIPADAAAIIFTRPTRDLTAEEVRVIQAYLARGGSLLLMTDVLFNEQPFMAQNGLFNRFLLEEYGIGALDAAVVDPALSGQTPLDIISANVFATSPIAARLDPATTPTLFSVARAVDVRLQDLPANIATGRVIFTTDRAYGETDLRTLGETNRTQYDAGVDLPGPLATVVWSTNTRTNARIVLIGDGDFVANGRLLTREGEVSFPGNAILFTDALVWLTNFNEVINFAPQMFSQNLPLIFVSQQQFSTIAFITVIFMPLTVLLIGVAIRIRRGRA
jgi:hypothetical protein